LHACGFFFGYLLARMLGIDASSSRTISIEVGMQVIITLIYCIQAPQYSNTMK
jgi:predicted Na+-dependent transporter